MDRTCRRWTTLALALFALSMSLALATTDVEEVGKQPVETSFRSGGSLKLDLCSSEAKIVGMEKERLRVAYDSKKDASKVSIRVKIAGSQATVTVDNCPHEDFRMTIEIPRTTDLQVHMAAGELDIDDVTGSKDLEMPAR